jgi:serralysin
MVDTVPGDVSSAINVLSGIPKNGAIDSLGDHDWYSITLFSGQTYTFSAGETGTGDLQDSYLRLRNGSGVVLVEDDDGGAGLLSQITFTATSTGTYFVDVGAFDDAQTGNFKLLAVNAGTSGADTVAGYAGTTGVLTLGASANGAVNSTGDHDWYAVSLTAGQSYLLSTGATGGDGDVDTYMWLRSGAGLELASNDDTSGAIYSSFRFTPTTSGIYYVDVGAYNNASTGAFKINFEAAPPLTVYTNDQIADYLVNGNWGGPANAHHFAVRPGGSLTVNITGLTAAAQTLAREALGMWTDVIGVTFNEVLTGGQIVFDDLEAGAFASAQYSGGITTSANINVGSEWLPANGTAINSYSFQTFVHEIGHALGLGHSGPYDTTASYGSDAIYLNDSWATTVMSYFDQTENTYFSAQGFTQQNVLSPMTADIIASNMAYGTSTTTRTGNTTYGFNNNSGRATFDAAANPNVGYTIVDSGGIDTLDYSGFAAAQVINLNAETFSNIGGLVGNVSIGRGTVIENANGGSGDDILTGNTANNSLIGGLGNDVLRFTGGTDNLTGGDGIDLGDYSGFASAVLIDLQAATQYTRGTNDLYSGTWTSIGTVSGIENLKGTSANDALYGDANNNTIFYTGGLDNYDGRGGVDTLDFLSLSAAVYIDLAAAAQYTRDTVNVTSTGIWRALAYTVATSFENAVGTAATDYVLGTTADNVFTYSGGSDDAYFGRGGTDTLDLSRQTTAVYADLGSGIVYDRANANWNVGGTYNRIAFTDSIENLIGGAGGDYLAGASSVSNRLTGGAGADSFVFRNSRGASVSDTITDFQDGVDTIRLEGFTGLNNVSQLNIVYDAAGAYFSYGGDPSQFVRVLGAANASLTAADFVFG